MIRISDIPTGNTKEAIKQREAIISAVYRKWYDNHPTKSVYNNNLKDFINVKYISITETIRHGSKSYLSTLAILQLDLILKNAKKVGKPIPIKKGVKNQLAFEKMQVMECNLIGIGKVKMTVGIKKSGMKVQYCITAIKA